MVLIGDFNAEMSTSTYQELTKIFQDANELTMQYRGLTYHGYFKEPAEHIDYCFVKGDGLAVTKGHLLDDMVDGGYPSDHCGLAFDID